MRSFGIWTFNVNDCLVNSGRFSCGGLRCEIACCTLLLGLIFHQLLKQMQARPWAPVEALWPWAHVTSSACELCRGALWSETTKALNSQAHNHLHLFIVIRERKKEKSREKEKTKQTKKAKQSQACCRYWWASLPASKRCFKSVVFR